MSFYPSSCDLRAKRLAFFGHTLSTKMGERAQGEKLLPLLQGCLKEAKLFDCCDFVGEEFERFAKLNYALAEAGHEMIELKEQKVDADIIMVMSFSWSLAALYAMGVLSQSAVISKLVVHHHDEIIFPKLYESSDLLVTESLLAIERGIQYGLPKEKMVYLPHSYPLACLKEKSRKSAYKLAKKLGKTLTENTVIIGSVSRLELGKNCEYVLQTVRELALAGKDVALILKGDFPENSYYPHYDQELKRLVMSYQDEPWLLWDPTFSSLEESVKLYGAFDLALQLSGAEAGSHVIGELLACAVPTIALKASTNPSLFSGAALLIETERRVESAQLPFYVPHLSLLKENLERLAFDQKWRHHVSKQGEALARERFHPKRALERLPLILEGVLSKQHGKSIESLYHQDRKEYQL